AAFVFELELGAQQPARIVGHAPQPGLVRLAPLAHLRVGLGRRALLRRLAGLAQGLLRALALGAVGLGLAGRVLRRRRLRPRRRRRPRLPAGLVLPPVLRLPAATVLAARVLPVLARAGTGATLPARRLAPRRLDHAAVEGGVLQPRVQRQGA